VFGAGRFFDLREKIEEASGILNIGLKRGGVVCPSSGVDILFNELNTGKDTGIFGGVSTIIHGVLLFIASNTIK